MDLPDDNLKMKGLKALIVEPLYKTRHLVQGYESRVYRTPANGLVQILDWDLILKCATL